MKDLDMSLSMDLNESCGSTSKSAFLHPANIESSESFPDSHAPLLFFPSGGLARVDHLRFKG